MARPVAITRKRVAESFPVGIRYQEPDIPAGGHIDSVSVAITAGLTLGTNGVNADATEVYAWVSGGTDGSDYTVTFTVTMSDTRVIIDDYLVRVRN